MILTSWQWPSSRPAPPARSRKLPHRWSPTGSVRARECAGGLLQLRGTPALAPPATLPRAALQRRRGGAGQGGWLRRSSPPRVHFDAPVVCACVCYHFCMQGASGLYASVVCRDLHTYFKITRQFKQTSNQQFFYFESTQVHVLMCFIFNIT